MSGISTLSLSQGARLSVQGMQRELASGQKEMASGRHADLGLTLGAGMAQAVSLDRELGRLDAIVTSNALVSSRLSAAQGALSQLNAQAESFRSSLTVALKNNTPGATLQVAAQNTLASLTSLLNTSLGGDRVFGGTNTGQAPINDWTAAGSPARAAFDASFSAQFGFSPDDPAVGNISKADMSAFLSSVEGQFLGGGWDANWSNASMQGALTRIGLDETADVSVGAADAGFRKLAMAGAILSRLGANAGPGAREALVERAATLAGEAVGDIAQNQGRLGITQKRVTDASARLSAQADIVETHIGKLEGVDPYEVSTRVTNLLTQIETAYAVTKRIQQLSLAQILG